MYSVLREMVLEVETSAFDIPPTIGGVGWAYFSAYDCNPRLRPPKPTGIDSK